MSLRQDGDAMFERNIAIIASRKQEVLIDSDGVIYEGFLCGLDEEWLQIYGHDQEDREHPHLSWRFVLINRNRINSIRTTGRDPKNLTPGIREWVEKRINAFANIAEKSQVRKSDDGQDR